MEPTKQDAEAMLAGAGGIGIAVRARSPREHIPFLAWGLLAALSGPVRDLGDDSVTGSILMWVAPAIGLAILLDYLRRCRQVRVTPRTPNWVALAFAAWYIAAATLLPSLVDDTIGFASSLGGILAAAPILWWADRLRKHA